MDHVLSLHPASLNPSLSVKCTFVLIVVLLGGVAGNTSKRLGFLGLKVIALGFIAILHTLTVMGKTSFFLVPGSCARMASREWGGFLFAMSECSVWLWVPY